MMHLYMGGVSPAGQLGGSSVERTRRTVGASPTLTIVQSTADDVCARSYQDFRAASGADYADGPAMLAAFSVSSPECVAWVRRQQAGSPPPSSLTDTQCASVWDAWVIQNGARYSGRVQSLTAFGEENPACAAWVRTQIERLTGQRRQQEEEPKPEQKSAVVPVMLGLGALAAAFYFIK